MESKYVYIFKEAQTRIVSISRGAKINLTRIDVNPLHSSDSESPFVLIPSGLSNECEAITRSEVAAHE